MNSTITQHQFKNFRDAFKARATNKSTSATDHILYNIVRGKSLDYGFTAITNSSKLKNGSTPFQMFNEAKSVLRHMPVKYLIARYPNVLNDSEWTELIAGAL